jgi:UDP-glucose 4-epimerase
MKILITGIAGLIGSKLADWIIENIPDAEVVGIDDLSGGYKENINPKVIFWQQNLVEHPIENAFDVHRFDYVFHFAAYAAEGLSPFIRQYNYKNNLIATTKIVNNCIKYGVKRLVFTSSMAVYGHGHGNIFHEDQNPNPIDPYGISKYASEMDIQVAGMQHDLDWCIIRPHNVYGVNQNIWDKYRNVLGIWMYQHLNNEPMTIFGDGHQVRAFSYIDDIVEPLWNAAIKSEASKQIINLGGIEEHSILEANEILRKIIGSENLVYLQKRHEVKYAIPTYQKSIDILEFKHKINLEEGLTKMWEWAQRQPIRERFVWPSYELDKGLYKFWQ